MYRPHGYVKIYSLDSDRCDEEDTIKCNHHQAIGFVQPGGMVIWPTLRETYIRGIGEYGRVESRPVLQEQYTCRLCYQPICPRCANLPCRHYEKWLEQVELTAGLRRLNLERLEEIASKQQFQIV